ncbi:MAG: hypothetical protein JXJ04_17670 [Spirochaetales bacterium]|nr:hypothetical protein [Spirochaetales bacterium]
MSHVNTSDNFIDWEGNPIEAMTEEQSKYVGRRDWFDNNPYYEFFTDPIIRFEIITRKRIIELFNKYWKMRYYKEFRFVEEELNRNGWATFDMG